MLHTHAQPVPLVPKSSRGLTSPFTQLPWLHMPLQLPGGSLQFQPWEDVLAGEKGKSTLQAVTCSQSLGPVGVSLCRNVLQQVNGLPHHLEASIQPRLLLSWPLGKLLDALCIITQYHTHFHHLMSLPMTVVIEGSQLLQA